MYLQKKTIFLSKNQILTHQSFPIFFKHCNVLEEQFLLKLGYNKFDLLLTHFSPTTCALVQKKCVIRLKTLLISMVEPSTQVKRGKFDLSKL